MHTDESHNRHFTLSGTPIDILWDHDAIERKATLGYAVTRTSELQAMMLRQAAATARGEAQQAEHDATNHDNKLDVALRLTERDVLMRQLLDEHGAALQGCKVAHGGAETAAASAVTAREVLATAIAEAAELERCHVDLQARLGECEARVARLAGEGRGQAASAAGGERDLVRAEVVDVQARSRVVQERVATLAAALAQEELQASVAQQEATLLQQVGTTTF